MKTNLEFLMDAVAKVQTENFIVYKNGQQKNEGFIIINSDTSIAYNVKVEDNEITGCTCPHQENRGVVCKHMVKVSMVQGLNIKGLTTFKKSDVPDNVTPLQEKDGEAI